MSGVEILSIIENPINIYNGTAAAIGFIIPFIICLAFGIYVMAESGEYTAGAGVISAGIIFGIILGFQIGTIFATESGAVETTYKVLISDEVSINDFMDKYEIIDQEGKIYTVRERGE
jgi:hypothetical protein